MSYKLIFPDGREVDFEGIISFLYNLGESELQVLRVLLSSRGKLTSEDIANKLKVSKASVNKAINSLMNKGLVEREKADLEEKRKGRPIFVYYVKPDYVYKKVSEDANFIVFNAKETIKKLLSEGA